jgi:hypothetical protein
LLVEKVGWCFGSGFASTKLPLLGTLLTSNDGFMLKAPLVSPFDIIFNGKFIRVRLVGMFQNGVNV